MAHDGSEQHAVISVSGPKVHLSTRRFSIREGLNQLFNVRIIANSQDPNIDLEEIVGQPALFQLTGGQLQAQYGTRRWTGIVAHAEQVHVDSSNSGESTYYFHIVPALWLTTQRRETRIFQHVKIPDIIKAILDEWGIESLNELNGFYREHEYLVQYNETDHAFINRICEWAGITYYFKFQVQESTGWDRGTKTKPEEKPKKVSRFQTRKKRDKALAVETDATKKRDEREQQDRDNRAADANMHSGWTTINEPGEPDDAMHDDDQQLNPSAAVPLKLTFSDGVQDNEPRALPIHYVDEPNDAALEEYITECRLAYNVAPGRYTIRDFDYRGKLDFDLIGTETKAAELPEDFYEQYHYVPGAFKVEADSAELDVGDKPKGYRHLQKEIGDPMAQRRWSAARNNRSVVRFVTNCVDLGPGVVFTMNHHPRADMDLKKYLIRKFTLEGSVNAEWTYEGEAQFQDHPFYPEMRTPKPRIRGLQSAAVVGPSGKEEIFCDELGRVKIQFHWDRDGDYDEKSSCWVRVSHDWAGTGFGTQFLPRIGQEVLVAFLEGDPDSPVIVGRAYNGINKVPYALPTFKERSGWKTDSTPAADGFSEITFEDRKEQEKIFIQAETDVQKLVKQYETHRVGNDQMTVVGEHRTSLVSKLDTIMVGERYLLRSVDPPQEEHNSKGKLKRGDALGIPTLEQPKISPLKTAIELQHKRIIVTTGAATVAFDDKNIRIHADGNISILAKGADCIIEGVKVQLNPGSPPATAPKPLAFSLPPHDGWKRHVADLLDDLKQKQQRDKINALRLDPPKPPSFVQQDEQELHQCFLMATLVHCMHPDAPREPAQDETRPDFHQLEIVPDPPELAGRVAGMEGEGQRGGVRGYRNDNDDRPDILVRPTSDDDPRQRYSATGKKLDKGEKGGFVKKHGDFITLKSKVHDNCGKGKHTNWRATGFSELKTQEGSEDWSLEIPGWIHSKLDNWNVTTADIEKIVDVTRNADTDWARAKADVETGFGEAESNLRRAEKDHLFQKTDDSERALEQAKRTKELKGNARDKIAKESTKWKAPVQCRINGFSWTAGVRAKRYNVTANACSGPTHKYTILAYPSDRFSIDFGFGKGQLFEPLDSWLKAGFGGGTTDTFFGEFKLALNSNVYFGGNAKWKEHPRDHRAFYAYQIKLSGEPLFAASAEFGIHLYHVLSWIPGLQAAGIGARAIKKYLDVAMKLKITGEIKGEVTFNRDGPDDLSGSTAGSITGVLTVSLALDAFFVKKEIAGFGAAGKTDLSMALTPKKDLSPMDPATIIANGQWKGFSVTLYFGIKFVYRGSKSLEIAAPQTFGPYELKPLTWINRTINRQYKDL